jgi:hypothetical protein
MLHCSLDADLDNLWALPKAAMDPMDRENQANGGYVSISPCPYK